MVWLFHRNEEVTRVETRFDNTARQYVVRIIGTGGKDTTEIFEDASTFETRVQALERELAESRWIQDGSGPRLLPDGWRI